MTIHRVTAIDVTAQLRGAAANPDAPVRAGHSNDGRVVLVLEPAAADRLGRILARFDAVSCVEEFPDRATWMHASIDLLASAAFAVNTPLAVEPSASWTGQARP